MRIIGMELCGVARPVTAGRGGGDGDLDLDIPRRAVAAGKAFVAKNALVMAGRSFDRGPRRAKHCNAAI